MFDTYYPTSKAINGDNTLQVILAICVLSYNNNAVRYMIMTVNKNNIVEQNSDEIYNPQEAITVFNTTRTMLNCHTIVAVS